MSEKILTVMQVWSVMMAVVAQEVTVSAIVKCQMTKNVPATVTVVLNQKIQSKKKLFEKFFPEEFFYFQNFI